MPSWGRSEESERIESGVQRRLLLLGILVVATVARYWAIDFCLPSTLCRPDEEAVVSVSLRFLTQDLNPRFFDWPPLFMYVVTGALISMFELGLWLGWYRGEQDFFEVIFTNTAPVFLTARIVSAATGVASVWLLYRVGRRLFDERVALLAALFLSLAFLHVRDSHFGVTDIPATCMVLVSFLLTVRFFNSGFSRDLIGAAFTAGLAASTKYNGAMVALPLLLVVLSPRDASQTWMHRLSRCALVIGLMALAFALAAPFALIEHEAFIKALRGVAQHLSSGHGVNVGRGWSVHLASSLHYGLGWPLLGAGITGLVWVLVARPRHGLILLSFPLAYYLVIGSGYTVFARYILPVVPFLCLAAAFAVNQLAFRVAHLLRRPTLATAVAYGLAVVILGPSAVSVVRFNLLLARTDSRVLVERWVMKRFPHGATIGEVGRLSGHLHFLPEGLGMPSRYEQAAMAEATAEPDILVIPRSIFDSTTDFGRHTTALMSRYVKAYSVETHEYLATGVIYDRQDEFYLPLTGFQAIRRPGPNLDVYVRPDLAARRP